MSISRIFNSKKSTIILIVLFAVVNPQNSNSSFFNRNEKFSTKNPIKASFIGEIIGYSYIKVTLETTPDPNSYNNASQSLKGSYFEAISNATFKITGSYNSDTFMWKLDCFDQKNIYTSSFLGKEDTDGRISGKWSSKKISHPFYLKKVSK
ncbi:MAG: hypothetical protein H7Y07_17340 [Pyrinomonadaceae bacterium]|nr:hypothetical protein [Sphingobacteriaceae bacterium]